MSVAATVIVPTHDHGPTLRLSVGSALAQTVEDIEVLVVGDGVPDVTREIVGELSRVDERVHFFDHPKGQRHGAQKVSRRLAEGIRGASSVQGVDAPGDARGRHQQRRRRLGRGQSAWCT